MGLNSAPKRKAFTEGELNTMISSIQKKVEAGTALTQPEKTKLRLAQQQLSEGRGHIEKVNKIIKFLDKDAKNKNYNK